MTMALFISALKVAVYAFVEYLLGKTKWGSVIGLLVAQVKKDKP